MNTKANTTSKILVKALTELYPIHQLYYTSYTSFQTFVSIEDAFKAFSRPVLKMSSTCLQRSHFTSSKKSWKRLEDTSKMSYKDIWEDQKLLHWRGL